MTHNIIKHSQALSKFNLLQIRYKNYVSITMSDPNDYRENITYENTIAQKNFVKKEDFDLQQVATEISLNNSKRKIKILGIICIICFLTIALCLISIFVIIGNGSNLGPVQDSSHSTQCLRRDETFARNERPFPLGEQIIGNFL